MAVRLIVERENEIKRFHSEEYFRINGNFLTSDGHTVRTELSRRLPDEKAALQFMQDCTGATYAVTDVNVRPVKKSPAPPFTTSTLQQEASRKLGFTVSQTMMVAQRLYEAGPHHLHAYRLGQPVVAGHRHHIERDQRQARCPLPEVRHYHTNSKGAQEAHEAIRPTYIDKHTIEGTSQEKRLYALIWKRTIASQMSDAEIEKTTVDITPSTRPEKFVAQGEVIKFDGFLKVYIEGIDDETSDSTPEGMLPAMHPGDALQPQSITAAQRFTQQPPRYTEASLVKKMEELGIGRPSTYAPTISTIQQREYVEKGDREGERREYITITLDSNGISRSMASEITGSERGKLIPPT